jgi:predicted regulator of Ras-like GTPase activity (Roadblock/LC7/MglB family)
VRTHVAEPWIEAPLQTFVDDARAIFALLLHPNGQVMGQFGFTRAVDVMAACALAAAIHASAGELGRELNGKPFREMYHAGKDRQIFIGEVPTTRHRFVFLTVFDAESSLGLVRIYFQELCALLEHAQPPAIAHMPISDTSLEQDLNHNLALLFGRSTRGSDGGESSISLA